MYLPRLLRPVLESALGGFPAVLVTGPRQSGKTTFLQREFGERFAYASFDDPLDRAFAHDDPQGFLDRFGGRPTILDEVQYVPELFQHLKLRIDRERRRHGLWLLTGSQQFQLMAGISESLAGRIALLDLLPLSLLELGAYAPSLADAIWNGGYPEPALEPEKRDLWLSSYLQTYVERDLRQLYDVQDLRAFETFLALAASRHGQVLNMADLGRTAGVTQPTIKKWLGALEAAFLVRLLPPYFENFGKRLAKAPKLYFLDPALVCSLTRQPAAEAALAGAMGGALFEGLMIGEVHKAFAVAGKRPDLYHWRSHDGLEVDLILRLETELVPIEIKLTATPMPRHAEALRRFHDLAGGNASAGLLVCRSASEGRLPSGSLVMPWRDFPGWLAARI